MQSKLVVYCLCLFAAVILVPVYWLGGFHAEFAGADEASHLVSGIMVYQYLAQGLLQGQSPMAFARDYYEHYPRVAIGHWPPVFYFVQAFWFLIVGLSRTSVMLLSVLITAALGTATVWFCRLHSVNLPAALAAGLLVVLSPQALASTIEFGSDPLVALLVFLAAFAACEWFQSQSTRSGLLFALLAATACLTKGNAFPLLLMPFFLLVFRRDLGLLRPMLLILLLVLPWYWIQRDLMVHEVVPGGTSDLPGRVQYSAIKNARLIALAAGPIVFLFAISSWRQIKSLSTLPMILLPLTHWLFLSFISPHAETRLMMVVIPIFCFLAAVLIKSWKPLPLIGFCLLSLTFAHLLQPLRPKPQTGFVPAVAATLSMPCPVSLITSNFFGEGPWLGEIAIHQPSPHLVVRRGSKLFQSSRWMGEDYRVLAESAAAVTQILDTQHIDCLIEHTRASVAPLPYKGFMDTALANWQPTQLTKEIRLYRRPAGNPANAAILPVADNPPSTSQSPSR
ncbi:MAG: hypothetical protein FJW36_11910 [Acidobacteria bacterium]|nr:hypothetical protein [Acidobacteriota bacterium]